MTTGQTERPTTPTQPAVAQSVRPDELRFSQASLTCVGTSCEPSRRNAVMGAFDAIMGANGMATQAFGLGATAAAASMLLAGGVSPAIAGAAAITGAVASFLNPAPKGNGRG